MEKQYQIIYADPPWHYVFGKTSSRYVDRKYNCMTKEELCDLPVVYEEPEILEPEPIYLIKEIDELKLRVEKLETKEILLP